jgi:hypothetical protein
MAKGAESLLLSIKWQRKLISRIKARIMQHKMGKNKRPQDRRTTTRNSKLGKL